MKLKKKHKILLAASALILLLLAGFAASKLVPQYQMKQLMKKENNLALLNASGQNFYILGTIHSNHLVEESDYSLAAIQNVIEHMNPDLILVEVRQKNVDLFNALDGPLEMIFAWSYATDRQIPVVGIDWWEITEDLQSNYTDDTRDDHIYENILESSNGYQNILVICGASHRIEQRKRFLAAGFREEKILNPSVWFQGIAPEDFQYPASMKQWIENTRHFYQNDFRNEVLQAIPGNPEAQEYWLENGAASADFLKQVNEYLVTPNSLYAK